MSDYKLVPVEPTAEMVEAFKAMWSLGFCDDRMAQECYAAIMNAAPAVQGEPVAWMHDSPDRVDVIHAEVKKLLVDSHNTAGHLHRPLDKSEHYTIPLYAAPQPAADVTQLVEALKDIGASWHGVNTELERYMRNVAREALGAYRKGGDQ